MRAAAIASLVLFLMTLSYSAMSEGSEKWVTSWAASAQGPYPSGNAMVQPDLRRASSLARSGRKGSKLPAYRRAGYLGARSPHPALQCLRNESGDVRWRFRGPATRQLRDCARDEPARDLRRLEERDRRTRGKRLERSPSRFPSRALFPEPISRPESLPSASMSRARAAP